jgi:quercetin dioxygenase-like cupin family protein
VIVRRESLSYRQLPGRSTADPFTEAKPLGLSMRVVYLRGGARRNPHRHPHSHEAIYVLRGRGALWEDGSSSPFEAGDCALIDPGVAHATIPDAGNDMELVCFFPHPELPANTDEVEDLILVEGTEKGAEG